MNSKVTFLVHVPKTGGNSVWRELLKRRRLIDNDFNYIATDTYSLSCQNAIKESPQLGQKILYNQERSYPIERTINLPKIVEDCLFNVSRKFPTNHDLVVHHHDARCLQPLLNSEQLELIRELRSMLSFSHDIEISNNLDAWDPDRFGASFVFTLRDPFERARSHLAHVKRSFVSPIEAVHFEPSIQPSFADRHAVLSASYDLTSFLEEFPQLLFYQKRFLISSFVSCSFDEESHVLWSASAEVIDRCFSALSGISMRASACILDSGVFSVIPILGSSSIFYDIGNIGKIDAYEGTKSYSVLQEGLAFESRLIDPIKSTFEDPFKF
ncbi:hypothetical protein I1E95_14785 [Synechococcus sp. CBW1107]|nr:hypothetical protein I1E95_14785 [Synechococcus sp. CBW1107]